MLAVRRDRARTDALRAACDDDGAGTANGTAAVSRPTRRLPPLAVGRLTMTRVMFPSGSVATLRPSRRPDGAFGRRPRIVAEKNPPAQGDTVMRFATGAIGALVIGLLTGGTSA